MAVVTQTDLFDLSITYFDGIDQLIPYRGFFIEGQVPYVPEDDAPGWVIFEIEQATDKTFQEAASELASKLFLDLGFTADQVIRLMEDF